MPLIYTNCGGSASHEAANRAAVRAAPRDDLRLVGLAVHGDRRAADKALKGLALYG